MELSFLLSLVFILQILDQDIFINNLALGSSSTCTSNIQAMIIPTRNFYNPLDVDPIKDDYRFPNKPISSTELDTCRFLQGARGYFDNGWDWETAFVWSKAYSNNTVQNRIAMDKLEEALNDTTAAAFNPFHGGVLESNIERTWVDVYRKNRTDLLHTARFKTCK